MTVYTEQKYLFSNSSRQQAELNSASAVDSQQQLPEDT